MEYRHIFRAAMLAAAMFWAPASAWVPAWAETGDRPGSADTARLLANRGQTSEAQGAHDDALADLTQAIEMHVLPAAEQARLLFDRGLILDAQGRLADALGDYAAAIQLSPRFAPALNNRANVYRRQNQFAEASRDYLASLAAGNPQPEYPWYGLGQVAEAQGNVPAARQNYARAVAANPAYQLAADRLKALGGTAPAQDDIIHLRPPNQVVAADSNSGSDSDSDSVALKPPPTRGAADAPVQLRQPRRDTPRPDPPRIAPARYAPEQGPGLRPALDNSSASGKQVQLGSWRSEEEAGAGWNKAVNRAGDLLDGLSPHIVTADLPGRGRYYRLRAGPVPGATSELCAALTGRGLDCMPVRN